MIDVPEELRAKAVADGDAGWLDDLPSIIDALAQYWSLTIGATLRGGHAALVLEVTDADGRGAVLKVGVPSTRPALRHEATALRLTNGDGTAELLRTDVGRGALLLERLGAPMFELIADPDTRHDLLCDIAMRLWRPAEPDSDLPTGADRAKEYRDSLPQLWDRAGRPCSRAAVDDAVACAERRRAAHDDRSAVLVHGDVHDVNALHAGDGAFKLVDPDGLRAEPACDLGTILRCNPGHGDDLRARAARLADRSGVDATAIWEWGTIYRVMSGLYCKTIGFQPFGDLLLAQADRLVERTSEDDRRDRV